MSMCRSVNVQKRVSRQPCAIVHVRMLLPISQRPCRLHEEGAVRLSQCVACYFASTSFLCSGLNACARWPWAETQRWRARKAHLATRICQMQTAVEGKMERVVG